MADESNTHAHPAPVSRRAIVLGALGGAAGLAAASLGGCAAPVPLPPPTDGMPSSDAEQPPPAPREWRAAWVASVANIDWPLRPSTSVDRLRTEASHLLDRASALGLNALILQVRPAADALYPSSLEPWSEFLTGKQGSAPEGGWDPLAYWVAEAHRRGLELHAWFNPYRARHSSARSPLAANHLARTRPDLVKTYGDQRWFDPGEPESATRTLAVITDVARRYDIDGVHVDDYFYPYPVQAADGSELPFPDDRSWQAYRRGGGRLDRANWRRDNVDRLVEALYREVHAVKPWLRVGISPFGIGKPALRPAGITGFSQYDQLYADVERWCGEGWLDYLSPQLYWRLDRSAQAFEVLLDYWLAQNQKQRHVWPGLFTDRVAKGNDPWPAAEVLGQIEAIRRRPQPSGHAHFSMNVLMADRGGIAQRLQGGPYAQPALVPASPWLDGSLPEAPSLMAETAGGGWQIVPGNGKAVWQWAVWRREQGRWRFSLQRGEDRALAVLGAERLVVSAIDRVGNESVRVGLDVALSPPGRTWR